MIRPRNRKTLARQSRRHRYQIKEWSNRLMNVPAFILGNGPSLNDQPLEILEKYFTIGVNRSFYLCDSTILLWQDIALFNTESQRLHNLQCLKICRDISDPRHIYYNFYLRGGPFRFENKTHILNGRGTTGPLAVQLAAALGCKPIVILGMDCKIDNGKTDFYGNNPHWRIHTLDNCKKGLEFLKNECPVPLINCSNNDIFEEKNDLKEIVAKIGPKHALGRQVYVAKLIHNSNKKMINESNH